MSAHHSRHSKVIGYFAYESPTRVVCTGTACIIAGSRRAMEQYLLEIDPQQRPGPTIQKTTFAEIRHGLELGAAYAFDKAAYKRLAQYGFQGDQFLTFKTNKNSLVDSK